MEKPGFTPGLWPLTRTGDGKRYVVGDGLVGGPGGYEVAEVYSDDCDPDEARANANLIAAAPELYEAVERALRHAQHLGIDVEGSSYVKQLRAALAKARGQ